MNAKAYVALVACLILTPTAYAQDEPVTNPVDVIDLITMAENKILSPTNQPIPFWNSTVNLIGALSPSIEVNRDLIGNESFASASVSVLDFDPKRHWAGLRLGVGLEERIFGSVALNLPVIFGNYIPDSIKNNSGFSPDIWSVIGNAAYVHIGFGYKSETQGSETEWILPVGFGMRINF